MESSRLLLLPHDQIKYESLSDEVLGQLARQSDDEFISTSALAELSTRGAKDTANVAREITLSRAFDVHSRAHALGVLFSMAPMIAAEILSYFIAADCRERKLLEVAIDGLLFNRDLFESPDSQILLKRFARLVRSHPSSFYSEREELETFLLWVNKDD